MLNELFWMVSIDRHSWTLLLSDNIVNLYIVTGHIVLRNLESKKNIFILTLQK